MNKPSIGRIVHYFPKNRDTPTAAIITHVWSDDCVNLRFFNDVSAGEQPDVATSVMLRDEQNPTDTWDWPARV